MKLARIIIFATGAIFFVIDLFIVFYNPDMPESTAALAAMTCTAVEIKEEPPAPEPEKEYKYIEDCPLDVELQQGIYDICEKYNVPYELVMAMIKKESLYITDSVGDNGDSVGLMQIQEKWHYELMEELGVSDLTDPLGNVEVGTALIASYIEESGNVEYALMKYNGGAAYADRMTEAGKVSDYAQEIMETAFMYERENGI